MTGLSSIVVTSEAQRDRAVELASRLGLVVRADGAEPSGEIELRLGDERLELCASGERGGVAVDFATLDLRPSSRSLSRRQPLARAVGDRLRRVVDATGGLGYDAALLAAMGHRVTAIERHPVIAALLEDGLRRAALDDRIAAALDGRLDVAVGDAREILPQLAPPPEVVYIDPMFPPKRKQSALPPKRVRLVRALVGEDHDATDLLDVARRVATSRVVLKRPTHVEPLAPDPVASHAGKIVRYDVYRPI